MAALPDIPEGSSCESLLPHPREDVESYNLQYILYDFDFESTSTFKMQPAIDADERDEIRRLRIELEGIDRRDLIHDSGQDK